MEKFKSIVFAGLIVFSNSALSCPKPVLSLQLGEAAPCKGFLFSPEKEQEVRFMMKDYKLLKEKETSYEDLLKRRKENEKYLTEIAEKERKKAELWRTTAEDITLKYVDIEDNRGRRDWLFLASGILLTVAAGYAIGQASK